MTKSVFVTVGTTEFDSLIAAATSEPILKTLFAKGYTSVTLQIGRGKFEPETSTKSNLPAVDWYRFKSDISGDIKSADLVIGHAGSGTCLEVLSAGRPLIVVVNESLHDNHQLELADRLGSDGHLLYCAPDTLEGALEKLGRVDLVPFEPGRPEVFVQWLDRFTRIVD